MSVATTEEQMVHVFYVDGGLLGKRNPCPEGVRWSVYYQPPLAATGRVVRRGSTRAYHTNNEAEWLAVHAALRYARKRCPKAALVIRSDSQIVVNQFKGRWRFHVRTLRRLAETAWQLSREFSQCRLEWVPRNELVRRVGH